LCILLKGIQRCARVPLWIAHLFIRFGMRQRRRPAPSSPSSRSASSLHVRPMDIAKLDMLISSRCS
jgi:hypothetical protein